MARANDISTEDSGGGTNAMERLLLMTERCETAETGHQLGSANALSTWCVRDSSDYVSVVKFCGQPILPPVMTAERREEMRQYKQQALIAETRLRAKAKQKLLTRVQMIMAEIDDKHGTSSFVTTSESDMTSVRCATMSQAVMSAGTRHRLDSSSSDSSQQSQHATESMPSPDHVDTANCKNVSSQQHIDMDGCVNLQSPQLVKVEDCVNTPSPRHTNAADKNTPDSGISSKDPTRTTDNIPEESAMLDTLADITNISSEEEEDLLIRTMAGVKLLSAGTDVQKLAKASGSEVASSPPSKIPVLVKRDSSSCQSPPADRTSNPQTHENSSEKVCSTTVPPKAVCQPDLPKNDCPAEHHNDQLTHQTTVAEKLSLAFKGQVARNQSQQAAVTSVKSSSSSGTTVSSDEMNQTVIAKADSSSRPDDSGTFQVHLTDSQSSLNCDSPNSKPVITGLLGNVALDSDTPEDCFQNVTPGGAFVQTHDMGPVFNVEFMENEKPVNIKPYSVAHHGNVTEPKPDGGESALAHSMAVTERTKSCDMSLLGTDSTELAAYMVSNADSMLTSATTLPHLLDMACGMAQRDEKSPEIASVSQQNVSSDGNKIQEENGPSESTGSKETVEVKATKHVRQSSYTLEHPSPALLARTKLTPGVGGETFELTSSMEDLRLKPVQRRLSYTDVEGGKGTGDDKDMAADTGVNNTGAVETHEAVAKETVSATETLKTEQVTGKAALEKENVDLNEIKEIMNEDGKEIDTRKQSPSEKTVGMSGGEKKSREYHAGKAVDNEEEKRHGKTVESTEDLLGRNMTKPRVHKRGRKELVREDQKVDVVIGSAVTSSAGAEKGCRNKPSVHDEREGKQEHLQRYLHTLSQMPPLTNEEEDLHDPRPDPDLTDTSSLVTPLDIDTLTSLSEDDLLKVQQLYFERLREQLVQQQQSQLAKLLAEQQKQQMLFQKEILAQEHDLLSQHRTSGDTSRRSSLTVGASSKVAERNRSMCEERKRRRRSHQETGQRKRGGSYRDGINLEMNGYGRSVTDATQRADYQDTLSVRDNSVLSADRVSTVGPLEVDLRPISAPVPKVSFDMSSVSDDHWRSHTPERRTPRHHSGHAVGWADVSYTSPLVTLSRMSSPHQASTPRRQKSHPSPGCRGSRHRCHVSVDSQNIPADVQCKLKKMSAAVKGYLTRRLLASEKVQQIIKTIKDTAEFALNFQQESPIKKGVYSEQDRQLQARVLAQLTAAMYEIHEIFFELPIREKMAIIRMSRMLERERFFRPEVEPQKKSPGVSAATLKMMARKRKIKAAEKILCDRTRPKSAPPDSSWNSLRGPLKRNFEFKTSRALRPKHAMMSPVKPTKDTINRLVAKKQQSVPAKRRLLHSRVPPKASVTNTIGDNLQKKGSKVVMKRVTAVGDGLSNVTTHHKVIIPRATMTTAAASRPKVKSVR